MDNSRNNAVHTSAIFVIDRPSRPDCLRRRWEAVIPREEVACLLSTGRYLDLLARLQEARAQFPRDLELLRSVRVIEDHLKIRTATG